MAGDSGAACPLRHLQRPADPLFARGHPLTAPKVLKEKHLRLDLRSAGGRRQAIWFNGALDELPRPPWDVAYTVKRNTWQSRDEAQIQIVAVRSCVADAA